MLRLEKVFRTFRKVETLPASPLSVNAELVYSYLLYRYHFDYTATCREIGDKLRLQRSKGVGKAMTQLLELGLAVKVRSRYGAAGEPEREARQWFGWLPNVSPQEPWYKRFRYFQHPFPTRYCPLTPRQVMLFGLVVSLCKNPRQKIAHNYLEDVTGFAAETVKSGVDRLLELGLVVRPYAGKLQTCELGPEQCSWFVAREQGEEEEAADPYQCVTFNAPAPAPAKAAPAPAAPAVHTGLAKVREQNAARREQERLEQLRAAEPKPPKPEPEPVVEAIETPSAPNPFAAAMRGAAAKLDVRTVDPDDDDFLRRLDASADRPNEIADF